MSELTVYETGWMSTYWCSNITHNIINMEVYVKIITLVSIFELA